MESKPKTTSQLLFTKVKDDKNQILDLYNLLEKREYNISHASLPSFREHSEFVANNPYREWFILYDANQPVGSFYIKNDNSIGINMLEQNPIYINMTIEFIKQNFKPNRAIASVVPPYFYFNVSISNVGLREILENSKLKSIQTSYIF